jgi:hypothetical protein
MVNSFVGRVVLRRSPYRAELSPIREKSGVRHEVNLQADAIADLGRPEYFIHTRVLVP